MNGITFNHRRRKMSIGKKVKKGIGEAVDFVGEGYNEAESKVDGFFVRNKYTVLILAGVAVALVVLLVL
jgi:hypothetical protein